MKNVSLLLLSALAAILMSTSCTTMSRTLKTPNNHVEFVKNDFTLSDQVIGEATSVKIVGIDFSRLFVKKYGSIVEPGFFPMPPVISTTMVGGKVNAYALYEMMEKNPGFDVIMYPTFEVKKTGIPIFFTTTTVKATARLGKLK